MLQKGVNEPSQSSWSFPIVLVQKKILYIYISDIWMVSLKKMVTLYLELMTLLGACLFSSLDLHEGKWQRKESILNPFRLYQFKVMPLDYLDDITISCTISEHFKHLTEISKKLRHANLKINPRKCFSKECKLLWSYCDQRRSEDRPQKRLQLFQTGPLQQISSNFDKVSDYLILQTFWETICSNDLTSISSDSKKKPPMVLDKCLPTSIWQTTTMPYE